MSEEYLWNREGETDPEVARLEALLGSIQHSASGPRRYPRHRSARLPTVAAVFFAGTIFLGIWLWNRGPVTAWQLSNGKMLRTGQTVETNASTRVTIESAHTGRLDIEPGSRLKLNASAAGKEKFHLDRGTIHALIWAPPGQFVVDTASAKTTDLGCSYTLQVSEQGSGLLTVQTGWVAFEFQQRESFIPAGAACVTRPGRGPGTPWFSDAPPELKAALDDFDTFGGPDALRRALTAARQRDGLSLWHLLVRTQGRQREEVFDRFAKLVNLPESVTKEAVLRGDAPALDTSWNALELGSTDWWRTWKRKW